MNQRTSRKISSTTLQSLLVLLFLSACASTPQSRGVLEARGNLPVAHEIQNVPFIQQSVDHCGPASLAMVASSIGLSTTETELSAKLFTPGKNGTLQSDLIGASRRSGLMAVTLDQLRAILDEVSADHPVIVFQNLGSSRNPIWHYAVVIGFDLADQTLLLHSGEHPRLKMDLKAFERTWQKAEHWALLVFSPQVIPESVSLRELLWAASGLERAKRIEEARIAYFALSKKWPGESAPLFGLGNTEAALGKMRESATAFERAARLEPNSAPVWQNLAEVYGKLGRSRARAKALEKLKQLELK